MATFDTYIRLKIKIGCENDFFALKNNFWYLLDLTKLNQINEFQIELKKILSREFQIQKPQFKLFLDAYLIPIWETTKILRDNDILHVVFENRSNGEDDEDWDIGCTKQASKKQKIETSHVQIHVNPWSLTNMSYELDNKYEFVFIGTSMIKHIKLSIKNSYLKALSGARIEILFNFIKTKFFSNCKYFMLTCGSNDCDSTIAIESTTHIYLQLLKYLREKFTDAVIFINELVPRTRTRTEHYENNRKILNEFLEIFCKNNFKYEFIKHDSFENRQNLNTYLYDGVHLHPINGVPEYIKEINKVLSNKYSIKL